MDIRQVYLKDVSFESPHAPGIFSGKVAEPKVDVQIRVEHDTLAQDADLYEVVLGITVTASAEDSTVMLVEVLQAGIFHLQHFAPADQQRVLQVGCPNVLLPFARETVSALTTKGGFPQLLINPVNFELLYRQKMQAAAKRESDDAAKSNGDATPDGD
jgi:preprotein translocase subunit SecB